MTDLIELARGLGGILALVFYASIVLWTYKDAKRRLDDPILVSTAVATSMLPIVGVLVYMLLRPPEYIADVRERELEIRAMERTLGRHERCPYCKSHIEAEYLSCPVCTTKLRQSCRGCEKPLDPRWAMCPYCEIEVPNRPARDIAPPSPGRGARQATARTARRDAEAKRPARESRSRRDEPSSRRKRPATPADAPATPSSDPLRTEPFQRFARDDDQPTNQAPVLTTGPSSPTSRPDGR